MGFDLIKVTQFVRAVQSLTIAFLILLLSARVNAQVEAPQLVYSAPDGKIQSFIVGSVGVIDIKADLPFISYSDARAVGAVLGSPYWQIRLALQKIPANTDLYVMLESEGGDDNEAKMIADTINARCAADATCRITTYVQHSCSSACIFMFGKIGNSHIAGPEARFGFHASRNISTATVDLAPESESVKFYADAGVNLNWLREAQKAGVFSKVDMTYFSASDMLAIGFVEKLSNPEAVLKIEDR